MSAPSRTRTIAFDVAARTSRHARWRSRRSPSVGWRVVATCHVVGSSGAVSGAVDEDGAAGRADRAERVRGGRRARDRGVLDEAEVRLRGEDLPGGRPERRRDDHLEEQAREAVGGRVVDLVGERHDAAERRDRVARERRLPRLDERRAFRGAARVHVLHDHAGRAVEGAGDRGCRRRVEDVVVRERLALERRGAGRERAVGGRWPRRGGSGPRAGGGSRRSAASRPSRGRSSGSAGTGRRSRGGRARRAASTPAAAIRAGSSAAIRAS